jgi:hypothetical protein
MRRDLETTVVLWHGQYSTDGRERLHIILRNERTLFGLRNTRLIGNDGDWYLVADVDRYERSETDLASRLAEQNARMRALDLEED